MISESPPLASPRHPFLALTPQARRHLAKVLISGLEAAQDHEQSRQTRHGLAGGGVLALTGAALYQGWYQLTGGPPGPFALWYGLLLGVQAGVAGQLAARGFSLGPQAMRWLLLAPAELARSSRTWLFPERLTADRLVLAAGILVAIRRPISHHLMLRLYGRAYPQLEVERAIALLRHLGLILVKEREGATVLLLSPDGVALLHELGVPEPAPRLRQDPAIAAHLRPVFAALEKAGTRLPPMPEMREPIVLPEMTLPPPRPAVSLPRAPRAEERLPWDTDTTPEKTAEVPVPPRLRRKLTIPWRPLAIGAAVVVLGALTVLAVRHWPRWPAPGKFVLSASAMPSSQGTALQFNGQGLLLSSFQGDLFLSIADRLDYKRPLSFQGFDMASSCTLPSGKIRAASMSPRGRFVWIEMATKGQAQERCLVDMETKTVTHDLKSRNAAYGQPAMIGWAGENTLIMAEEKRQAPHWWLMDVTTHHSTALKLPTHGRLLLLPSDAGSPLLMGLDMRTMGTWDMTTYWLDQNRQCQKLQTVRAVFPESLKEQEPIHASVSPDKRYVMLTLRPVGTGTAGPIGSLLVVSLSDGTTSVLDSQAAPVPEQPAFWGPEVRGGRYRFYFNGYSPDGVAPWTGELQAEGH